MGIVQKLGRGDDDDLQQMVLFAVRVGGRGGRDGLHARSRVAFVPEIGGGNESRVLRDLLVEKIVERALGGDVVLQRHDAGDGALGARAGDNVRSR